MDLSNRRSNSIGPFLWPFEADSFRISLGRTTNRCGIRNAPRRPAREPKKIPHWCGRFHHQLPVPVEPPVGRWYVHIGSHSLIDLSAHPSPKKEKKITPLVRHLLKLILNFSKRLDYIEQDSLWRKIDTLPSSFDLRFRYEKKNETECFKYQRWNNNV